MGVGKILRTRLHRAAARRFAQRAGRNYFNKAGPLRVGKKTHLPVPTCSSVDENLYRGDAYATYAWACDIAESK